MNAYGFLPHIQIRCGVKNARRQGIQRITESRDHAKKDSGDSFIPTLSVAPTHIPVGNIHRQDVGT